MAQMVKNLPAMPEIQVQSLGREDTLEREISTHSSNIAWRISWKRSLVGYSPWDCTESDITEQLTHITHTQHKEEGAAPLSTMSFFSLLPHFQ